MRRAQRVHCSSCNELQPRRNWKPRLLLKGLFTQTHTQLDRQRELFKNTQFDKHTNAPSRGNADLAGMLASKSAANLRSSALMSRTREHSHSRALVSLRPTLFGPNNVATRFIIASCLLATRLDVHYVRLVLLSTCCVVYHAPRQIFAMI